MTEKPRWRWWLFCAALALYFRFWWEWARRLFGWCVLPTWLGADDEVVKSYAEHGLWD